jgi:hypothetical protein
MKRIYAVIATLLLAGCAGASIVPGAAPTSTLSSLGMNPTLPDVTAPPKCKGQKQSKDYASVAKEPIKEVAGGNDCVPAFGGWGGDLQFPGTYNDSYTVSLTSSTTAYKGGLFPPGGSQKPIFYLQIDFSGFPGFYKTLPKGNPLESTHLTAGNPYTILVKEYFYALGWDEVGECYQIARKAKDGNGLADAGTIFEGVTILEMKNVLEVFKGELVSNQC